MGLAKNIRSIVQCAEVFSYEVSSLPEAAKQLKALIFAYDVTRKTNQQPDCIKSLYIDHIKDQIDRSRDLLSYAVGRPNSSHYGTASKEKLPQIAAEVIRCCVVGRKILDLVFIAGEIVPEVSSLSAQFERIVIAS